MSVEYNNLPNVIAYLPIFADSLARNVAESMKNVAEAEVPVRTGALKLGINLTHTGMLSYEVTAKSMEGGAHREYANYVEYGTSHMAAQPFMGPGYVAGVAELPVKAREFGINIDRVAGGH